MNFTNSDINGAVVGGFFWKTDGGKQCECEVRERLCGSAKMKKLSHSVTLTWEAWVAGAGGAQVGVSLKTYHMGCHKSALTLKTLRQGGGLYEA